MTYVSTHHFASDCADALPVERAQNTIAKLINSIGDLLRNVSRRRHLKTLGQLSDQQLSDIGLYHDDIYEAKKLGYNQDVTCHLAEIARRRRLAL
jgi:uncharacterized protein YjiS (DUF1127 family)